MNLKGKKNVVCEVCGKKYKISSYGKVCSQKCAHVMIDYNSITLPIPFIKKVYLHTLNEKERNDELKVYAKRHSFNESLVIKKADEVFKSLKLDNHKKVA